LSSGPLPDLPILPRIPVRLTASQLLLAKPGLTRMVESITRVRSGDSPNPFMPADAFMPKALYIWDPSQKLSPENILRHSRVRPEDVFDNIFQEKNDLQIAERIMQLWKQVWPLLHGKRRQRLQFDFVDLCLCEFAVRALRKQVAHHHFEAPRPNYIQASRQLLRVLEKLRKCARRAAIREIGREGYNMNAQRWRSYARWLHAVALSCRCGRKPGFKHTYQFFVRQVMKIAERELRSSEDYRDEVPDQATLRKWSRQLLRQVRRHRAHIAGARSLVDTPQGASIISIYMRGQIWKQRAERISREKEKETESTE
jgi:hypothetical protein